MSRTNEFGHKGEEDEAGATRAVETETKKGKKKQQ